MTIPETKQHEVDTLTKNQTVGHALKTGNAAQVVCDGCRKNATVTSLFVTLSILCRNRTNFGTIHKMNLKPETIAAPNVQKNRKKTCHLPKKVLPTGKILFK